MPRSPPGKPNMALPGVNKVWRSLPGGGVARDWYAWRGRGAPHIARFEAATRAEVIAQEASVEGAKKIADGYANAAHPSIDTTTLGGVLKAWKASSAFKDRAESTKRNERTSADHIVDSRLGAMPTRALAARGAPEAPIGAAARRRISTWLDEIAEANGPRAADHRRDILSKALNWAVGEGLAPCNPAEGIADHHHADRSDIIWLGQDLPAFEAKAREARRRILPQDAPEPEEPPGAVLALLLTCYSGLRREDLCRLAEPHLSAAAIVLKPLKSVRRARTAKQKAPPDVIVPRTPELNAVLAMCLKVRERWEEKDGVKRAHILLNAHGKPWTPSGLTSSFIKIRDAAGIRHVYDDGRAPEPKTLHDGRGTFVTHMRCLGYSKEEVADMVGWTTADVDRVARKYADADRIALAWLERLKRGAAHAG